MALSSYRRGLQDERRPQRNHGDRQFGPQDEGFERRGWRPGSDYYGSNPERYGPGTSNIQSHEARGDEDAVRQSFNDRWQDSYGESARRGADRSDWHQFDERTGSFERNVGQFRGRGPKAYRRSDERIREDACERLTADERIDASDLEVTVKDGEVNLSGTVTSREQKRRAEDIVATVSGAKEVNNGLRVVNEGREIEAHRISTVQS